MLNELGQQIRAEFQANHALCQKLIDLFHLVANKPRFRIVCVLARGNFCVNEIAEIVGETRLSNISQQLKILTLAGVVERRRDERRIIYRLVDDRVRDLIDHFREKLLTSSSNP